ncbi:MAG: sigma-70 family RNA polymerase sigma factor [Candidatus Saccharimonas sp.]|nr:sigma-70 family RNA polymerase sigma factor [Planctomycetaceae bacterium]
MTEPPDTGSNRLVLARISTIWSNVLAAHQGHGLTSYEAQSRFFERYHGAILRYLLACVRNEDAAADLFQEFALRFVRGDFRNLRPHEGSFRQYLKTALINLVRDHQSLQAKLNRGVTRNDMTGETFDAAIPEFDTSLRTELLAQTWQMLHETQMTAGPPFYSVLKGRVDHPEWSIDELSQAIAAELGHSDLPSNAAFRKLLQRARDAFANRLLDLVGQTLGSLDWARVEEVLVDLELLAYCQSALQTRRQASPTEPPPQQIGNVNR